jgi:nucleoside 2-deoxyribosyltransferase
LAQIVIVDFTGFRSGVFFEAGFAKGIGREVIWTCREDYFDQLSQHFDTRQYQHIKWTDPQDLRDQLRDRIRATIGTTA